MDERQEATEILSESECWELLDHAAVGRLAVDIAGQPDIFPINFVVDKSGIVFRSAAGTKLAGAVLNRLVAFEIDGYEPGDRTAWSVVVKGQARADRADAGDVRRRGSPAVPLARLGQAELRAHRADRGDRPALPHRRRRRIPTARSDGRPPTTTRTHESLAAAPTPGAPFHPGEPKLHAD